MPGRHSSRAGRWLENSSVGRRRRSMRCRQRSWCFEDDPAFDAGYGSHLNLDGQVQLDAIIMDGATLKAGRDRAVEHVRNPILLARAVLEKSEHMMLVADRGGKICGGAWDSVVLGARQFDPRARTRGVFALPRRFACCGTSRGARIRHRGRRGAGSSQGSLIAATSTGGTCCKFPGRVGRFAADRLWMLRRCGSGRRFLHRARRRHHENRDGQDGYGPAARSSRADAAPRKEKTSSRFAAQAVADACVRKLALRAHTTGGLILLDHEGNPAAAFNTPQHGLRLRRARRRISHRTLEKPVPFHRYFSELCVRLKSEE